MITIPVLGIPHYNRPDLLVRCIESIDCEVDTLAVVRNGPLRDFPVGHIGEIMNRTDHGFSHGTRAGGRVGRLVLIEHPNAGVAASWNEIIKLFPARYWVLVNNDIKFAPGDLMKLGEQVFLKAGPADGTNPEPPKDIPGIFYGNHGASFFAVTAACIGVVGLFDENIYPAYLEDCDYAYRMKLMGVPSFDVRGIASLHGTATEPTDSSKGSSTIHSDPYLRSRNGLTHGNNFKYYRAKWGGDNGKEIYRTPFNTPWWPVWAWRFDPCWRQRQVLTFHPESQRLP